MERHGLGNAYIHVGDGRHKQRTVRRVPDRRRWQVPADDDRHHPGYFKRHYAAIAFGRWCDSIDIHLFESDTSTFLPDSDKIQNLILLSESQRNGREMMYKNIFPYAFVPDTVVNSISEFIKEKRIVTDPLIKDSIFSLLEEQCTVLYYPQNDEENDGFHVQRIIKNNLEHFVYINTHKAIEKQVFTAAHELGHIMQLAEYLTAHCKDYSEKYEENCMNRFAADILMPKDIFLARVRENYKHYSTGNNIITKDNLLKFSIYLMDYFLVPFKAVLIRLFEIEFLQKNLLGAFESKTHKISSTEG